jgi:hypothetical protein
MLKKLVEDAMSSLVEFPLEGDGVIWVEVNESDAEGGIIRAGRFGGMIKKVQAKVTFDEALHQICASTERIITKLHNIKSQPDEIEVVFGFKMNAEIGASIAKACSEANYTVTMKWLREDQKNASLSSLQEKGANTPA